MFKTGDIVKIKDCCKELPWYHNKPMRVVLVGGDNIGICCDYKLHSAFALWKRIPTISKSYIYIDIKENRKQKIKRICSE